MCNTVVSVYLGTWYWYRVPEPDCTTWWCSGTVAVLGSWLAERRTSRERGERGEREQIRL